MQAIVTTIWRGITWFFSGFQRVISSLWDGIASAFLWVAEWLSMFLANLMTAVIEIVFKFAELAIGLLPNMPETDGIGNVSILDQANQYLPLAETFALLGVWSAIFGAVAVYKLIKLVSPVSA